MTYFSEHHVTRIPWGAEGLSVIAHTHWCPRVQTLGKQFNYAGMRCISHAPAYKQAKEQGGVRAAYEAVMGALSSRALNILDKSLALAGAHHPIFVAPYTPAESGGKNMLGIQFARVLAERFDGSVAEGICQTRRVGRRRMDSLDKILHQPEFCGAVVKGGNYVIVDDLCYEGGTIATLRGYIEDHGGHVVCATVLANGVGSLKVHKTDEATLDHFFNFNLAIESRQETLFSTTWRNVNATLENYCGFGVSCLTRGEARTVASYGSRFLNALLSRAVGFGAAGHRP